MSRYFLILILFWGAVLSTSSTIPVVSADTTLTGHESGVTDTIEFENDAELREGIVIVEGGDVENDMPYNEFHANYPFIRHSANTIQLNGDDWDDIKKIFSDNSDHRIFTFMHIGDSHLQADIATSEMRRLFQNEHGNGGRGLVVPFKLAGTNEPSDYRFSINCGVTYSRLLKKPWINDMGFTGIGVSPKANSFDVTIETKESNRDDFRFVRVYATGEFNIVDARTTEGYKVDITVDKEIEEGYVDVFLERPLSAITLSFYAPSTISFHGMMLSTEREGVFYHVIGNNGATYSTYNNISSFGSSINTLYPDLIIVSLGTNEAFGKITSEDFYHEIHTLVKDIRAKNPESKILLTTPKECQRRLRRKGRKSTFAVVDNCKRLRDVILRYGKENKVAIYDWYEVAGGDGASSQWIKSKLLSADRVHNTRDGYLLYGMLFHSALERALSD